MVDISKIKPGDKITVELTVVEWSRDGYVRTSGARSIHPNFIGNHIDPGDIISYTPRPTPIEIGTKFPNSLNPKFPWTVLSIYGRIAWCATQDPHFLYPQNLLLEEIRRRITKH